MPQPKILLFDLETAPILLYGWSLGKEIWDYNFVRRNWFVLCWSAKWLGKDEVMHSQLPNFRGYKKLPSKTQRNIDKKVMKKLWHLLDECDVAVAHNLKGFDNKKALTRFIIHGMKPPSPYHLIDTLSVARSNFKFTSNRLGYISDKLCVETKMDKSQLGGFNLWLGCEEGDKKSWELMKKYCNQDVRSLEDVYLVERPYMSNHPNLNVINEDDSCPKCGHDKFTKDGFRYTNTGKYQKLRCNGCGGIAKIMMRSGVRNG